MRSFLRPGWSFVVVVCLVAAGVARPVRAAARDPHAQLSLGGPHAVHAAPRRIAAPELRLPPVALPRPDTAAPPRHAIRTIAVAPPRTPAVAFAPARSARGPPRG